MIDLTQARALAVAARADTSDGLEARELLPGVVDRLSHDLLKAQARGDHWKRAATEMERDRDRLAAQLREARSLRLAHPADAVDPERHTPERVITYLRKLGWVREGGAEIAELWRHPTDAKRRVMLPLHPGAVDYARALGFLVSDLADLYGPGQLVVLAAIEAAGDA